MTIHDNITPIMMGVGLLVITVLPVLIIGCTMVPASQTTPAHYEVSPVIQPVTNSVIATGKALAPATGGLSDMLGELIAYLIGTGATIATGIATHKLIKSHTKSPGSGDSTPPDATT